MRNHLLTKVIFLCLLVAVLFVNSTALLDHNLALRFFLASVMLAALLLLIPVHAVDREEQWLLAYFLFCAFSVLWSLNKGEALVEVFRVLIGLGAFVVVKSLVQHGHERFIGRALMVSAGAFVLVNGASLISVGGDTELFIGTSAHPNLLSSLLFLFVPFLVYFNGRLRLYERRLMLVLTGLIAVMLLLLKTRSALLAAGVYTVLLAFPALAALRKHRFFLPGCAVVVLALGAFLFLFRDELFDAVSLRERLFVWSKTLLLIRDHWLTGVGAGNWELHFPGYGIGGFDTFEIYGLRMQRPHNDFLWVLAETGVVGLLLMSGFFVVLGRKWLHGQMQKETYVLAAAVPAFFVDAFFSFPKERIEHVVLFFLLLALLTGKSGTSGLRDGQAALVKYVLVVLLAAGAVFGGYRIKGEYFGRKLLTAVNAKEPEKVLDLGARAGSVFFQLIPGGTPITSYLAEAHRQLGDKASFLHFSEEAYRQAPFNFEVVSNYGMSLNAQRKFEAAREVLLRAHFINPSYDGATFNLAIVCYNMGAYAEAKQWMDRVRFKSPMTDHYSGLIHQKLGIE